DVAGRRLPLQEIRVGGDPVVALRVPADGDYVLNIANLGFHGGPEYVYRMTLSTSPYVPFALPLGGRAGETREFELFALTGTDQFRSWKQMIRIPAGITHQWTHGALSLEASDAPEFIAPEGQRADKP